LDSATQEFQYQMKECYPPIITESEFQSVQEERAKRSNVVTDDSGMHRSSKKYSSRKKKEFMMEYF
jgi:site-specific DNA recombinase